MNKSEIRKKIISKRKKNYFRGLAINPDDFLKFLKQKKINKKSIGGYYPYNYEISTLKILKKLEKKNTQFLFQKLEKIRQCLFINGHLKIH